MNGAHVFYAAPGERRRDGWRSGAANRAMRATLAQLRERATAALGLGAPRWAKRADGAPAPEAGWCWSASHARGHVALAVAPGERIGLDLEPLDRPRPRHAAERLRELGAQLSEATPTPQLIDLWTRVEAVLKLHQTGLGGLGRLRIQGPDLSLDGRPAALLRLALPGVAATLASDAPLDEVAVYPAASPPTADSSAALAPALPCPPKACPPKTP